MTSFLANSISVVAQIKLFEFKFLYDVINIYLFINCKMDWSGDNSKLLKLLLRKVIKFVPHICGLSPKVQKERWQRVTEEFFADDFAIHLKEIHYKIETSYKILSRRYNVEEKLVSKVFGLDTGRPMNLSCFTGDY